MSAESLASMGSGIEVIRGSLTDLDVLTKCASSCDGVIHCAFIYDLAESDNSIEVDLVAVQALRAAAKGTIIITSGTTVIAQNGEITTEQDTKASGIAVARSVSESAVLSSSGSNGIVIRLPASVHGKGDHILIPAAIAVAREKGVSAYIGEGKNRWPAVHRNDAAVLYRLALEKGIGGVIYHTVAETGVSTRKITEAIGKGLGIPVVSKKAEEAAEHFGWISAFFETDNPTSSEWTKSQLGWEPKMDTLVEDMLRELLLIDALSTNL